MPPIGYIGVLLWHWLYPHEPTTPPPAMASPYSLRCVHLHNRKNKQRNPSKSKFIKHMNKIHKLSSILLKRSWHHPRPSGCPKWWVPSSPWAVAWPAVAIACTATCQGPGRRIPAGLSWNGKYRGWQWKKILKNGGNHTKNMEKNTG